MFTAWTTHFWDNIFTGFVLHLYRVSLYSTNSLFTFVLLFFPGLFQLLLLLPFFCLPLSPCNLWLILSLMQSLCPVSVTCPNHHQNPYSYFQGTVLVHLPHLKSSFVWVPVLSHFHLTFVVCWDNLWHRKHINLCLWIICMLLKVMAVSWCILCP